MLQACATKAVAAILSQIHFVCSAFGQGLLMLLSIHGCMRRCGMSRQMICQSQKCGNPAHDNLHKASQVPLGILLLLW